MCAQTQALIHRHGTQMRPVLKHPGREAPTASRHPVVPLEERWGVVLMPALDGL
jgi:hypothetical protein